MQQKMDREIIEFDHKFTDLSQCTEYFLDELGKFNSFCPGAFEFNKKEQKRYKKRLMSLFDSSLDSFERRRKVNDFVDKTEVKQFDKAYKKEHSTNAFVKGLKATISFPKKAINFLTKGKKCDQIDVISEGQLTMNEQQEKLSYQRSTSEEVISIEDTTQAEG